MGFLDNLFGKKNETNSVQPQQTDTQITEEKNSYYISNLIDVFSSGLFRGDSAPYSLTDIETIIGHPQYYPRKIRNLGKWAYNTNGAVRSGINKMSTMHYLTSFLYTQDTQCGSKRIEAGKKSYQKALDDIQYKQFIRDCVRQLAIEGTICYYFETGNASKFYNNYMSELETTQVDEINSTQEFSRTIALPIDYCMRIGRYNNYDVVAFDLKYFDQFNDSEKKRQLLTMPKEIRDAYGYYKKHPTSKSWKVLNYKNTIFQKIGSSVKDKWGVPLAITALDEIMYAKYFIDTKRGMLSNINNNILYEVFPMRGDGSGKSTLTEKQQQMQHEAIKTSVSQSSNKARTSVLSLAAGTQLNNIKIDTSLFDDKNEKSIKDNIAESIGFSPSALYGGSKSSGSNYATALLNLELVANDVYAMIENICIDLDKCINSNIIKDDKMTIKIYISPTTVFNKDKMFDKLKTIYADCGGAVTPLVAATGVDPTVYFYISDYERANKFDEKYSPHQSMYTQSSKQNAGRPSDDTSINDNTIVSKNNNANDSPSPDD